MFVISFLISKFFNTFFFLSVSCLSFYSAFNYAVTIIVCVFRLSKLPFLVWNSTKIRQQK